jgi:hypothetical protein
MAGGHERAAMIGQRARGAAAPVPCGNCGGALQWWPAGTCLVCHDCRRMEFVDGEVIFDGCRGTSAA